MNKKFDDLTEEQLRKRIRDMDAENACLHRILGEAGITIVFTSKGIRWRRENNDAREVLDEALNMGDGTYKP